MEKAFNTVKGKARDVLEYFSPIPKESSFTETGTITPEEFVAAGDHIVHHCPTWQWASGDPSKLRSYLPEHKQFLITRNVPCYKRFKQMEHESELEFVVDEETDPDGGWVDTHHYSECGGVLEDKVLHMALGDESPLQASDSDDDDNSSPVMDMDAYVESGMLEQNDVHTVQVYFKKPSTTICGGEIVHTRSYDLHITYDKYYHTPRLWLTGYDENRQPLTVEQMYEDFSQDHAHKTVTMEMHPHMYGPPMASIHPCRHAETMKKLYETSMEGGKKLDVHLYLIVFLKFVQAIIPTIEYDFTHNFAL